MWRRVEVTRIGVKDGEARRVLSVSSIRVKRCQHCQRLYVATGKNQRYCSPGCRKAASGERSRKGAEA